MESEARAEPPFDPAGNDERIGDLSSGLDYQMACDTISIAISKMGARRIQGYVENDRELVHQMTVDIARAHQDLHNLVYHDTDQVQKKHGEYMAIARSIPGVAPEILLRYHQMVQEDRIPLAAEGSR